MRARSTAVLCTSYEAVRVCVCGEVLVFVGAKICIYVHEEVCIYVCESFVYLCTGSTAVVYARILRNGAHMCV